MRRLSGLQTTPLSGRRVDVRRRLELRALVSMSHRSLSWLFSSYEGSATCTTIHRPSGLTCGGPTRFMSHMSSCVGTTLAAAAAAGTSNPANNSTARTALHRGNLLMHFMAHTVAQSPLIVHHLPHLVDEARLRAVKGPVKPQSLVMPASPVCRSWIGPASDSSAHCSNIRYSFAD